MPRLISVTLGALLVTLAGSAMGLAVNALRPARIPLVAPFPYEQDCPDKVQVQDGPTLSGTAAVRLVGAPDVLFIDARPDEAFSAGHIEGARSIPFSFISPVSRDQAAVLRQAKHLVVYCDSPGDRLAGLLAQQLRELKLSAVKVLQGGYAAYRDAARKMEAGR